jgi:hypothetical protein
LQDITNPPRAKALFNHDPASVAENTIKPTTTLTRRNTAQAPIAHVSMAFMSSRSPIPSGQPAKKEKRLQQTEQMHLLFDTGGTAVFSI